ncbi:MAG: uroporphyrinogen decarboxylase family protein, partial [Bryobacteraceae bacterium]
HNFMMAAHEAGISMSEFRSNPESVARSFIQAVDKYGYDGIVVDIDTATLAGALGVPVEFPEHEPAVTRGARLARLEEVRDLDPPDISRYRGVQVWLEAVRLLVRHFNHEVFVRGNCDQCPFSLASQMRGAADWMLELTDPACEQDVRRLLDYALEATLQFIRLMATTGAHMLSNGDSPAGPSVISPRLYREFAWAYERRVVEETHRLGLPYMLHICGKTEPILADMAATGADALELDYKTDARRAHDVLSGRTTFVGNLDPTGVLALGTPALVAQKTRELMAIFSDTPRFILNAGCAIPANTPPENLHALIGAARTGT